MSAVMTRDFRSETSVFEATEARLYEWGDERNRLTDSMGMPRMSTLASVVARQTVFEQQVKGTKILRPYSRQAMRQGVRSRKCQCGTIYSSTECPKCGTRDARTVAIGLGNAPAPAPQYGKDTRSHIAPIQGFTSSVAQIQVIVDRVEKWMQRTLYRSYQHRQPDRIAARELHVIRERYTAERIASVAEVAARLAYRREGAIKSAPPNRVVGEPPTR
jgi:hypothetical protein